MDAGPGAAQIRERDRERLLEKLLAPVDADDVLEDDAALADTLMERMEVRDIALALVRSYRSAMPQPEDLIDLSTEEGRKATRRTGFDDVAWFRMDIGRRQNADPRWLLPLLCRRGHITRNEIGAIRIGPAETYFQVPKAMEERFRAALQRTAREGAEDETGIRIEPSEPPREMARTNRRQGNGPNRPREGFPAWQWSAFRWPTPAPQRPAAPPRRLIAQGSPRHGGRCAGPHFTPRARPAVPAAERAACWPAPRHRHRSLRPPAGPARRDNASAPRAPAR
jgi:ATP-dependent RNA helicase DeaD